MAVSVDAVTKPSLRSPPALPATPDEAPLAMPVQSLSAWHPQRARRLAGGESAATPWVLRAVVFGSALLLTAFGAYEMYLVVSVTRTTFLQWILLALFTVNFSWIALAFTSAIAGFFKLVRRRAPMPLPASLATRTAIVMPVYNEETKRTYAALQATCESVMATGLGEAFDFFILSDSTHPDAWIAEERAFLALRERLGPAQPVYYRRRPRNHHRKAGNIADFVTRWGGRYEHMIILDADSLMTGDCIVRLAAAMEADPDAGIIQTLPLIVNRNTLLARVQQFAARIYGPVIAAGLSAWMGRDGNYWGHNAIIRMEAFAANAGLPDLRGKPPFGGHILSHDFVEAALIRRGGWTIYMLPDLVGSYEESPPSLIDLSIRDRRWCQGNLQHARLLFTRGLKLASRQHFATGIMAYLASPFWLLQLFVGIILVLQTTYIRPEYFADEFALFPVWPSFDPERALALFALTIGILLAPKFLGLGLVLANREERRACGGGFRLTLSCLIEIILSALYAPIMMLIQSGSVFQILLGRDTGWNPQKRDDGSIPFRSIVVRHGWHTLLGIVTGIAAFLIATALFVWMSPTILGLVLAIPLSWMSGQLVLGLGLRRAGLLATPEETSPPPIVARANALQSEWSIYGHDEDEALRVLHRDRDLLEQHIAMLQPAPPRMRGVVEPARALAEAKLADAETIDEAARWLAPAEKMAVLQDPRLLTQATQLLPERSAHP